MGYAKKRAMEEAGEVEMKDVDDVLRGKRDIQVNRKDEAEAKMELNGTE